MELDEARLAWQSLGDRMERLLALDLARYRDATHDRLRLSLQRELGPMRLGLLGRGVSGGVVAALSAAFWLAHRGVGHLVASGVLLQAYGLLLIVAAAWERHLLDGLDVAAPVLAIQRRLERLRAWRLRLLPMWIATGSVVWIPATLMLFEAGLHADLVARAPDVVAWFVAGGIVTALAFWAGDRWLPVVATSLRESTIGARLERSRRFAAELAAFEAD